MSTREHIFSVLATDPALNAMGITADTLYENEAPDTPEDDVFAVLDWGVVKPLGVKRLATGRDLSLSVYDRDASFDLISRIIQRWCELMESIVGVATPTGSIFECGWIGDSGDGYDEAWSRSVKSSSYTIVASGI